jgi:hypothetical protein
VDLEVVQSRCPRVPLLEEDLREVAPQEVALPVAVLQEVALLEAVPLVVALAVLPFMASVVVQDGPVQHAAQVDPASSPINGTVSACELVLHDKAHRMLMVLPFDIHFSHTRLLLSSCNFFSSDYWEAWPYMNRVWILNVIKILLEGILPLSRC